MTVTRDATSGKPIPQTSAEWTALLTGSGISNPSILLKCQEASGSLADSVGSFTFAPAGSPLYQQSISGWTSKAVSLRDNTTDAFSNADGGLPDLASSSCMVFAWIVPNAPGAGLRCLITTGGFFPNFASCATTPHTSTGSLRAYSNGNVSDGPTSGDAFFDGTAHPILLLSNHTANATIVQNDVETLTPTRGTVTGQGIFFGANDLANANGKILYAAAWFGAAAELDSGHRSTLITLMNTAVFGGGRLADSSLVKSPLTNSTLVYGG